MPHFKDPTSPECINKQELSNFMKNGRIQNIPHLRSYIKNMLGAPVICIEISDEQIDNIIRDTIQYIQRYYYDEGSYSDYLILELIPNVTKYKIAQDLEAVVDFRSSNWLGSINDLFTVPHNLLNNQTLGMNMIGGTFGNNAYGGVLGNWTATLTWMKEARQMFGEHYTVNYNEKEKELTVLPSVRKKTKGMIQVYRRQRIEKIFNDFMFKKMVVAKTGMVWTNALRKYSLNISGGGTLNADSLYSSYKEDYDWCIDKIEGESPVGIVMTVG